MDASVIETPIAPPRANPEETTPVVAVVGLGYVGLPTALSLTAAGVRVVGFEVSAERVAAIRDRRVDLLPHDHDRLARTLAEGDRLLRLETDPAVLTDADAVLICVPTPVDEDARPDLGALKAACTTVTGRARPGQTLVLTSTTYVGSTRDLLVEPLARRGLTAGEDVHVAFAPERIDPGNAQHAQETVPRVVGGATPDCAHAAAAVLERTAERVHEVTSLEAAELCKLYENTFRAVNIALANELAGMARDLGVDPLEVIRAAATKPYGYMPFFPGPGVGGHCIPCDPHYLLHSLPGGAARAPLVGQAMQAIAERPAQVADRALALLARDGIAPSRARVLIVGAAYKPGVADVREAPALEIAAALREAGAEVAFHDPVVGRLDGAAVVDDPRPEDHDLAVVVTVHPDQDVGWLDAAPRVLDATYRTARGRLREVV